ncbi:MAG: AraC family transcriptional regulator [Clostridia bacterium]|nr:AraC family transcriptional regulator [Clostridia bacterium]
MFYQFNHPATADYFRIESGTNFSFPAHIHECFELITVYSGTMRVNIDEQTEQLHAGESVLIFPGQTHSMDSALCQHHLCIFSPKLVPAFFSAHSQMMPKSARLTLPPLLLEETLNIEETASILAKKGLLYLICDTFDKGRVYLPRAEKAQGLIEKIFLYITQNYKETCDLKSMAAQLGYDYAYLSRFFKRTTGISFNKYVNMYRLDHACFLLENGTGSILTCAIESGYPSIRSFNRNFKSHLGLTPNEYLRQKRNKAAE